MKPDKTITTKELLIKYKDLFDGKRPDFRELYPGLLDKLTSDKPPGRLVDWAYAASTFEEREKKAKAKAASNRLKLKKKKQKQQLTSLLSSLL